VVPSRTVTLSPGASGASARGTSPAAAIAKAPSRTGPTAAFRPATSRTAAALTRALRAGTLDLAILAQAPPFRPPDAESPPLQLTTLSERDLVIGVPASHPFASARAVEVKQLQGQVWVASRSDPGESLLGVWPGLPERPDIRYVVRDWLAKLQIVAAGLAITTLPPIALDVLPEGIRVVAVRGEPQETRRLVLAHRPGPLETPVEQVAGALIAASRDQEAASSTSPVRWPPSQA
jgi:DNA-binding transcriptional LysR family regulator